VNRAPAQFNPDKLLWLNGEYIKEADDERLAALVAPRLRRAAWRSMPTAGTGVALLKERARTLNELADAAQLFFARTRSTRRCCDSMSPPRRGAAAFAGGPRPSSEPHGDLGADQAGAAEQGLKMPQLAVPLRVRDGRTQTPSIDAVLELIGRDAVLQRLDAALRQAGVAG